MPLIWVSNNQAINPDHIIMITAFLINEPGTVNNTENQQLVMRIDTDSHAEREAFMIDVAHSYAVQCYSQLRELGILMPNEDLDSFVEKEMERINPVDKDYYINQIKFFIQDCIAINHYGSLVNCDRVYRIYKTWALRLGYKFLDAQDFMKEFLNQLKETKQSVKGDSLYYENIIVTLENVDS